MYRIYKLVDPRDGRTRYIGYTSQELLRRLGLHIAEIAKPKAKSTWIRELYALSLFPRIELIEEVSEEQWHERERYWIAFYQEAGEPLFNTSPGGKGNGRKLDDATKAKMAIAASKRHHTPETRAKISALRKGQVLSPETRAKLQAARRISRAGRDYLYPKDVIAIRQAFAEGVTGPKLAEKYNTSISTVYDIKYGRTWKYLL